MGGRGGRGKDVSHLLFVDETFIFCDASQKQLTFLSWILMWVVSILWLRIKLGKSKVILIGGLLNVEEGVSFGARL